MNDDRTHSSKDLIKRRKALRKSLTSAEAFLWKHLKAKQLGDKKFGKQHSIAKYIVDFYCASEKLIVELDGEVHQNAATAAYDEKRTAYLNNLGYEVIRFENKMVFDNLQFVLMEIREHFVKGKS